MVLFQEFLELLFNLLMLPITFFNLTYNHSTWVADRFFTFLLRPPILQRFPILKLPKVPQELILQHVDKTDLFLYSLESRVFRRILMAIKPYFSNVEWTASDNNLSVYTTEDDEKTRFINYQLISSKEFHENKKSEWYREVELNGVKLQLHRDTGTGFRFYYSNPEGALKKEAVQAIWDLFFDCFRSRNISISSYFVPKSLVFNVFIDMRRSKFIKSLTLFEALSDMFYSHEQELLIVLEGFPVLEFLNLQWLPMKLKHQKPLKIPKMKIHYGDWLTVDCLLGMETEDLEVLDCNLTSQDINKFVKHWMKGGYNQLKSIKIGHQNYEFLLDQVLEGIDLKAWDDRQFGDSTFPYARFNNGRMIRRDDGKTAAVVTFRNVLSFHVFH